MNGVSTSIFGLSWSAGPLLTYTKEVPEECVQSVLQIRDFLNEVIGGDGIAGELLEPLRLIRGYCVRFLHPVGATEDRRCDEGRSRHLFREPRWSMDVYRFGEALGELRAGVGLQVANIMASYRLDAEEDLARGAPRPRGRLPADDPCE